MSDGAGDGRSVGLRVGFGEGAEVGNGVGFGRLSGPTLKWALTVLADSSPFQMRNSSIDPDSPADPDSKDRPR